METAISAIFNGIPYGHIGPAADHSWPRVLSQLRRRRKKGFADASLRGVRFGGPTGRFPDFPLVPTDENFAGIEFEHNDRYPFAATRRAGGISGRDGAGGSVPGAVRVDLACVWGRPMG
jgi:hypothetical protein